MEKIDFKKKLKHLYQPSDKEVVQVDVPTMNYLNDRQRHCRREKEEEC